MWGQFVDIEKDTFYSCGPFILKRRGSKQPLNLNESKDICNCNYVRCKSPLPNSEFEHQEEVSNLHRIPVSDTVDSLESLQYDEEDSAYESEEEPESDIESDEEEPELIFETKKVSKNTFCSSIRKICWNSNRTTIPKRKRNQRRNTEVLPYSQSQFDAVDCVKNSNLLNKERSIIDSLDLVYDQTRINSQRNGDHLEILDECCSESTPETGKPLNCCSPVQCINIISNIKEDENARFCEYCLNLPQTIKFQLPNTAVEAKTDANTSKDILMTEIEVVSILIALHPKAAGNEAVALKLKQQFLSSSEEKKRLIISKLKPEYVVASLSKIRTI